MSSDQLPIGEAATVAPAREVATPGSILRRAREAQGYSMSDVALAIRLSQRQIALLEADAWDQLPGETFVRGFLRNYARFLKIDPEPLLAAVASTPVMPIELHEGLHEEVPYESGGTSQTLPILIGGGLLLVAAVAVYFLWPLQSAKEPVRATPGASPAPSAATAAMAASTTPEAAVSEGATASAVPAKEAPAETLAAVGSTEADARSAQPAANPDTAVTAPTALPDGKEGTVTTTESAPREPKPWVHVEGPQRTLRFTVQELAWIEVLDAGGNTLIAYNFEPGTNRTVRGVAPLQVIVGNVAGVAVTVDGEAFDLGAQARANVARITVE